MSEIIDFTAEVKKKNPPDQEHIFIDEQGIEWFEFYCSYAFEDKEYGFCIWAKSTEDADQRLKAINGSGEVKGQMYSQESAPLD